MNLKKIIFLKRFLLDEVLLWVKPEFHNKIKEKWPPSF